MREAGYEVAVTALDAPRLKDVGYDVFLDDKEVVEVGRVRLEAIHTPGHTEGSICFKVAGSPVLFSGDTLFPGGPGNTTFEGGDFATIIRSLDDQAVHAAGRHDRAARARRRHHHRHRAPPPPGVGRPRLVIEPAGERQPQPGGALEAAAHERGPRHHPDRSARPTPRGSRATAQTSGEQRERQVDRQRDHHGAARGSARRRRRSAPRRARRPPRPGAGGPPRTTSPAVTRLDDRGVAA